MNYVLAIATVCAFTVIAAMSLNVLVGAAGKLSMTQGALMGVGAYTTGVLSVSLGVNPLAGIFLGAVMGAVLGALFALLMSRAKGYEYVLISLVLQMTVVELFRRGDAVTGGTSGLGGIARPEIFGFRLTENLWFAALAVTLAAVVAVVLFRLSRSGFFLGVRGFRNGETGVAALGLNVMKLQVAATAIAGFGAGLAGGLYASMFGFISPSNFTEYLSIMVVVYLLVGGIGNMWGAIAGVILMVSVPEVIAIVLNVPVSVQGPLERILYGVIIVLFVLLRPRGIIPERPVFANFAAESEESRERAQA